jgi:hypothetical protein
MEFAIVEKVARFIGRLDVNADDSNCYHGIGQRSGVWYPNEPEAWANTEGAESLAIARIAGQNIAGITKPASQFVVTAEVAESVDWGRWVKLESVGIVKAVDVDYTIGPNGWPKFITGYHGKLLSELLRERFACAEPIAQHLFEVRVWRLVDALDNDPIKERMSAVRFESTDELELTLRIGELAQEFGLIWHRGRIVVGEPLYKAISPFVDRRFFNVSIVKVTKDGSVHW